jgi:hypothetical protein
MQTLPDQQWLMELNTGSMSGAKPTGTGTSGSALDLERKNSAAEEAAVVEDSGASSPSLMDILGPVVHGAAQPNQTTPSLSEPLKRARSLVGVSKGRPADDFYITPSRAVEALLSVESFEGLIWEPACGTGAISDVLKEYGHDVLSSDLFDKGYGTPNADFLKAEGMFVENIITNPPFRYAQEFVDKALGLTTGKTAMLLKLAFLEGRKRSAYLQSTPLKNVWVFSKRLKMSRGGNEDAYKNGGMITFAWFVWEHGYEGRPMIGWI